MAGARWTISGNRGIEDGITRIGNQVDHHLGQFVAPAENKGKLIGQIDVYGDAMVLALAGEQGNRVAYRFPRIHPQPAPFGPADHAHALDQIAHITSLVGYQPELVLGEFRIVLMGLPGQKNIIGGETNRVERLIQFMGDTHSQFAKDGQPRDLGHLFQILCHTTQLLGESA